MASGVAGPRGDASGGMRQRILDAAAECLIEGGFASGRILSAIARKAGMSRPTLYKYGGTVEDIRRALVERELTRFLEALAPRLEGMTWSREYATDLLVFVVGYARGHTLLNAALRDVPEIVLPEFTLNAEGTIRRISELAAPIVQRHIDAGAIPPVDVGMLTDALFRITLSIVLIRGPYDFDDPEVLRRHLHGALGMLAELS
ncbi:TetR/AcrR family transcriptional regulator [Actinomadura rupiterrae]|uniref:TetR/AcrR family transcriptional regulator n=1 Tax=Actinomadura rupiterrae TaxID=559627 RepID=UPI0020A44F6D|nr:TetR/AcrR family transcriptional regulator [Actinomadura rupiterrae]MCP2342706.1 AcrR family transcriptional regulator [Actinomadura rupiterrae]